MDLAKLFEHLNWKPEIYHLNESHALPLLFHLYDQFKDIKKVRSSIVFTNHTPEQAGNPETDFRLLYSFCSRLRVLPSLNRRLRKSRCRGPACPNRIRGAWSRPRHRPAIFPRSCPIPWAAVPVSRHSPAARTHAPQVEGCAALRAVFGPARNNCSGGSRAPACRRW